MRKNGYWFWFDMDGTIANLYAVENWLAKLEAEDASPYREAAPLLNLSALARQLNKLRLKGYSIGIISWTSKAGTTEYNEAVKLAKLAWLEKHLPSVKWDAINIVPYGTNKWEVAGRTGVLFDDELKNLQSWGNGMAWYPTYINEVLSNYNRLAA